MPNPEAMTEAELRDECEALRARLERSADPVPLGAYIGLLQERAARARRRAEAVEVERPRLMLIQGGDLDAG